jgi:AraC-like DNA-binding protein
MINFGSLHSTIDRDDERKVRLHRESWICGLQTGYLVNQPLGETRMIGIRFKPAGAWPFLQVSMAELTDQIVDLELIWGREAGILRERLAESADCVERFRILEEELLRRLVELRNGVSLVRFAVREISGTNGFSTLRELSQRTGCSQKHMIDLFRKAVGVPPKTLHRLLRFQQALSLVASGLPTSLADLAIRMGYSDQSHFNKDFVAFTGMSPTAYLAQRRQWFGGDPAAEACQFVPVG